MTFSESISACFSKYATFTGTASKSEFWWFFLFTFLVSAVLGQINAPTNGLFCLATLLPSFAVGSRRLHDTDRSGWWQLLYLLPLIGWIVLIVFWVQEGRSNRYESPMNAAV